MLPRIGNAQYSHESEARKLLQAATAFQARLADSGVTIDQAIQHWRATAADPIVKKDPDAYAIALGSEAILEIQKNDTARVDSLFKKALPLFRLRDSKAPILVAYAEWMRGTGHNMKALRAYDEIVHTMDSIPALWNIAYYRLSGYAPYAYAIDASFGLERIAASDSSNRTPAIALLANTMFLHPNDALGMMAVVALHKLHEMTNEDYKFKVDLLCSRKPELRKVNELFEEQLGATDK